MAGVSARRAPESRSTTKLLHAAPKTRHPPSVRLKRSAAPKIEEMEVPAVDNVQGADEADLGDQRDDRSSSLSDPDDDIEDVEDHNGLANILTGLKKLPPPRSQDVDSEAETERLEQTPQKLRRHAENLGRTPSKLSQAATADDELSEPPSPLVAALGATSSTSTGATAGQKRKRSDTADSSLSSAESDIGESPRKRSHEITAEDQIHREEVIEDVEMAEESAERMEETPTLEEARDTPPIVVKGLQGRRGKPKGKKQKEMAEENEAEAIGDVQEAAEEPSEEDLVKTEEQRKAKLEASGVYDDIAKIFRSFRERLCNEQLATLNSELEMLEQPNCTHPEYLRQVACVDARREKQTREAHAFYKYKLQSIRERTLGERSQIHGQYFQDVRQLREDVLDKLGEQWYAIQKERRQSHSLDAEDSHLYMYDPKYSAQLKRQEKYNLEVSILSGMAQHVGFPAAPEIRGAESEDINQDLKNMKVTKNGPKSVTPGRALFLAGSNSTAQFSQNERLAHEQYLEQNAWARPQMPVHAHGTPGISHTPDWADSHAGKHMRQNVHLGARTASPFATPLPQSKMQHYEHPPSSGAATIGINSDGIGSSEAPMPSSAIAAPPTSDRMALFHQHGGGSNQASPLAFPRVRENGVNMDPPGFRNFSGMSGASTIDAPPDGPAPSDDSAPSKYFRPGFPAEHLSTPQPFPTSQIHSHSGSEGKDAFSIGGFRPQVGSFGTPAPLPPSVRKGN